MHWKTKFSRQLYTLLFFVAIPLVLLRLLIRSRKQPDYRRRWHERFGIIPCQIDKPSIWLHTVSVGETIAAIPLIEQLIAAYPDHNIHITTTTPTGSAQVKKHFADRVTHSYLPYDIPFFLNRFICYLKPKLCIILETEIWPNLLLVCRQLNIPTLLANARFSEKSYHGYLRLGNVAADLFNLFTHIAAQSELDADHYEKIGVAKHKISVTGNIKFDSELPVDIEERAQQLKSSWHLNNRPVWIAASTRDGEAPLILNAFKHVKTKHPNAFLMLVPRHPDRADKTFEYCSAMGFNTIRRSANISPDNQTDIMLGDTIGEMLLFYATSDIAFVGGSLVNLGGHNMLEPAALGLPIITGPYLRNFKAISRMLVNANAQLITNDANTLATTVIDLMDHPEKATKIGENAQRVFKANKGANKRLLAIIARVKVTRVRPASAIGSL